MTHYTLNKKQKLAEMIELAEEIQELALNIAKINKKLELGNKREIYYWCEKITMSTLEIKELSHDKPGVEIFEYFVLEGTKYKEYPIYMDLIGKEPW